MLPLLLESWNTSSIVLEDCGLVDPILIFMLFMATRELKNQKQQHAAIVLTGLSTPFLSTNATVNFIATTTANGNTTMAVDLAATEVHTVTV
jgi:hypothetical protein